MQERADVKVEIVMKIFENLCTEVTLNSAKRQIKFWSQNLYIYCIKIFSIQATDCAIKGRLFVGKTRLLKVRSVM